MSDNIADFITRIRNAYMAGNDSVEVKFSKINKEFLSIFKNLGFISNFASKPKGNFNIYKVILRYTNATPAICTIARVSKSSVRVYSPIKKLKKCYNGFGVYVLSTSKGIIPDHEARKLNVGGEVLFYVF